MKSSKFISVAIPVAAAAFFLAPAAPVRAQIVSQPIAIRASVGATPKSSLKGNWLKAEVIHADSNSMIVRERDNGMMIHTFTYSPQIQAQMQKLSDQGGYQYGDKVKILYQQGQTVAMRVHGKPSKTLQTSSALRLDR